MTEEQRHLIPKLPGQTTDEVKVMIRQVFEYVYKNFTEANSRKYLHGIQLWLYFRRLHSKQDYSIPVLNHTGKEYPDLINWTLQDNDSLPANAHKLQEIQKFKQNQHLRSVLTYTSKTTQSDKPMSTQTTPTTTTAKPQPISISQALATTIHKNTGASSNPPPSPPKPHQNNTPTSSPNSSPDRMPSLKDKAISFPQAIFDGKDKSKTHTHLQSFEDFVDRQKLDPATDLKEIQEYFLMTLCDLARQWLHQLN